jgi:hypothetical protein
MAVAFMEKLEWHLQPEQPGPRIGIPLAVVIARFYILSRTLQECRRRFCHRPASHSGSALTGAQPSGERPKADKSSSRSEAVGSPSACRGGQGSAQASRGPVGINRSRKLRPTPRVSTFVGMVQLPPDFQRFLNSRQDGAHAHETVAAF